MNWLQLLFLSTLFLMITGCADLGEPPNSMEEKIIPALSINNQTVVEGDSVNFIVSLSDTIDAEVSFIFVTVESTATENLDYPSVMDTMIIPAGSASVGIGIPTIDDSLIEVTESFYLSLSSPTNAVIDTAIGMATIIDNDSEVVVIPSLSVNNNTVTEGDDIIFTVTLSEASNVDVAFSFEVSGGTATANDDFTFLSGAKIISTGSIYVMINIPTVDDNLIEGTETFNMIISSPINASINIAQGIATIIDNDSTTVSFTNDIQPLLNNNSCLVPGCHGTNSFAGGLTLGTASYNEVISAETPNGFIIIPYNSSTSSFYLRLTSEYNVFTGQRMPSTFIEADTLTTNEQDLIKTWIDEGALDN